MAMRFSTVDILKQAIALSGPNAQQLKVMLEALRAEAIPRAARQQMWTEIGVAAQRSLVQGYTSRRLRRPIGPYRAGDDRYSGALGKALRSESMWRATPYGLYFINRDVLDKEARHWRRLNFGAGAGGKEGITAPGHFPVSGLGMMMGLAPDPRPPFRIPPGYWIGQGTFQSPSTERVGQDAFYLARHGGLVAGSRSAALAQSAGRLSRSGMTRGIASRNFLDPAIRRIGVEIKPGLDRLWATQRSNSARSETIRKKTGRARLPRTLG